MAIINLPGISTGEVVRVNSDYFVRMIGMGVPCWDIRPVIMFGPTGVGKSAAVMQIKEQMEMELGKKVIVIDIRLTSCTITDLIGIPTPNVDKTETIWLRPEIYSYDKKTEDDTYFIYFFDELDKASPAVQAAALQLILDRTAWVHKFPKNTLIIAAANPARGTKNYETRMAPELLNRFRQYNVQPDYDSFKQWGSENELHEFVMGYLAFDHSKLYAKNEQDETAFPTPRSWKSVSDLLKAYDGDFEKVSDLHYEICSDIGVGEAFEFEGWCDNYKELPLMEEVFEGTATKKPNTPDAMYALISAMIEYVKKNSELIYGTEIKHAYRYLSRFPEDYIAMFFVGIKDIDGMIAKSMKVDEFKEWYKKHPNTLD